MKSNLVIVAHPDDETIWMGGTILANSEDKWTIISLCRKTDPDRAPKFKRVCQYYGAKSIISDLDDEVLKPLPIDYVLKFIEKLIPKPQEEYDCIYTHGANGEYGHLRHKESHRAVIRLFTTKKISAKKLLFFSYTPGNVPAKHDSELMIPIANPKANVHNTLSTDNLKKKLMLVKDIYGFSSDGFEASSCGQHESFDIA